MDIDFAALMRAKTDAELKSMVEREAHDWDPRAIAAAREELQSRGVAFDESSGHEAPLPQGVKQSPSAAALLGMIFGGLVLLLGIFTLLVSGPSLPALAPIVSGGALLGYFATRSKP